MDNTIRMTEYSHDSGCDYKIPPKVLDTLLKTELPAINYPTLLVENSSHDDAVTCLETGIKSASIGALQKISAHTSSPLVLVQ